MGPLSDRVFRRLREADRRPIGAASGSAAGPAVATLTARVVRLRHNNRNNVDITGEKPAAGRSSSFRSSQLGAEWSLRNRWAELMAAAEDATTKSVRR
jgi:hypothetical protein